MADTMSSSSADLSSRLSIDASKVKDKDRDRDRDRDRDKDKDREKEKDEPQNSNNSTANGAGDGTNLPQDSLSLMQLKRVVGDMARARVRLLFLPSSLPFLYLCSRRVHLSRRRFSYLPRPPPQHHHLPLHNPQTHNVNPPMAS